MNIKIGDRFECIKETYSFYIGDIVKVKEINSTNKEILVTSIYDENIHEYIDTESYGGYDSDLKEYFKKAGIENEQMQSKR